jgi:hypothetical protein
VRRVVNPLGLNASEIDALRELQAGMPQPDTADPIWDELVVIGLVDLRELVPQLTPLGERYRTD